MTDKALSPADDDRPDTALQRALAHAPDQSAVPDFRIGKAIRRAAHDAVAPLAGEEALLPMLPADRPWWHRLLFGGSKSQGRMPWNAAFATVLVGVLVTLLWQREPVPGPQLDSQAPAVAPAPVAPASPSPSQAGKSEASPRIALPPTVPEAPVLPGPPTPPVVPDLPFQLKLPPAPPAAAKKLEQSERLPSDMDQKQAPSAPGVAPRKELPSAPAPSADASLGAAAATDRRAAARLRDEVSPAAASAGRVAAPAAPANAPAAEAANQSEAPPQPSFAALSQWTRITITAANGESRSFTRAEARELGALLGSAAITAVSPQPLRNRVDWRATLERDGQPLARFELARGEVRWRENGLPPSTGQPPEGALDGLRDALREAMAQPRAAEPSPPVPEPPR